MLNVPKLSRVLERATFYKRRPIVFCVCGCAAVFCVCGCATVFCAHWHGDFVSICVCVCVWGGERERERREQEASEADSGGLTQHSVEYIKHTVHQLHDSTWRQIGRAHVS